MFARGGGKAAKHNVMPALSHHWTFNVLNDPKRLAFVLARYAFAARVAGPRRSVLELGCSEGVGAALLAAEADEYLGVDLDSDAIDAARTNLPGDRYRFEAMDFLGQDLGSFHSVVSLDVIEHIERRDEDRYLQTILDNTAPDGIAVIGTPNVTASDWASPASQEGHVNLFDAERLDATVGRAFHHVFSFGLNDEVVHTGFAPMSHYLLAVGAGRCDRLRA
jgi:2-polyprenyl-3-methyl-5-hydroxy-6-metoxy-1,4-benzoquinol methylase